MSGVCNAYERPRGVIIYKNRIDFEIEKSSWRREWINVEQTKINWSYTPARCAI